MSEQFVSHKFTWEKNRRASPAPSFSRPEKALRRVCFPQNRPEEGTTPAVIKRAKESPHVLTIMVIFFFIHNWWTDKSVFWCRAVLRRRFLFFSSSLENTQCCSFQSCVQFIIISGLAAAWTRRPASSTFFCRACEPSCVHGTCPRCL